MEEICVGGVPEERQGFVVGSKEWCNSGGSRTAQAPPHHIHTTPVPTVCDVEHAQHVH
jgi:hypothetical protein